MSLTGIAEKRTGSTLESATKKLKLDISEEDTDVDTDIEPEPARVHRALFPSPKELLEQRLAKVKQKDQEHMSEEEILELNDILDQLEELEWEDEVFNQFGDYIMSPDDNDLGGPYEFDYLVKTPEDATLERLSRLREVDDETDCLFQAQLHNSMSKIKPLARPSYDPLDSFSDSEEEETSGEVVSPEKQSEKFEIKKDNSLMDAKTPPGTIDRNYNKLDGKTAAGSSEVEDETVDESSQQDDETVAESSQQDDEKDMNMNPGCRRDRPDLPEINADPSIAGITIGYNLASKRWHYVNGLDLNFPGSFISVGSCCSSLLATSINGYTQQTANKIFDPAKHEDVGIQTQAHTPGAMPRTRAVLEKDQKRRRMVHAPHCVDLWTFLTDDDGLEDVPHSYGGGWLELVETYKLVVRNKLYPPPAAFHRIMIEGVRDYPSAAVRGWVYSALRYTYRLFSPDPGDLFMSKFYLEVMSTVPPTKLKPGLHNENEPWNFLRDLMERAVSFRPEVAAEERKLESEWKKEKSSEWDSMEEDPEEDLLDIPGIFLLFQFWLDVLETDLRLWHNRFIREGAVSFRDVERPLLARVLFLTGEVRWNKRCETVCHQYALSLNPTCDIMARNCLRKLLSMVAQLLNLSETMKDKRYTQEDELNLFKSQISRYLANIIYQENFDSEILRKELFLLDPSWLSAHVSIFLLGRLSSIHIKSMPGLRDILEKFVNIQLDDDDDRPPPPAGQSAEAWSDGGSSAAVKVQCSTPAKGKSPRAKAKIDMNKRNQYGEYKIHLACKKKTSFDLQLLLQMPGVDVNLTDFNKNTPLHEAVCAGNLENVQLLLNFVPQPTIDQFFTATPKKDGSVVPKKTRFVDLLASDEHEETPVHYALSYGRTEILRCMLGFLYQQEEKKSPHFPSLAKVMDLRLKGRSLEECTDREELRSVLREYGRLAKETSASRPPGSSLPLSLVLSTQFQVLLRNAIHRYIGANNLVLVYRIWKVGLNEAFRPETVLKRVEQGTDIPLHKDLECFQPVDYRYSKPYYLFDRPPKFDVHRSDHVRILDIRGFESLRYLQQKLKHCDPRNPIRSYPDMFYP